VEGDEVFTATVGELLPDEVWQGVALGGWCSPSMRTMKRWCAAC